MLILSAMLLTAGFSDCAEELKETVEPVASYIFDASSYSGGGMVLGAASILSGIGWGLFQMTPWSSTYGQECRLATYVWGLGAKQSFSQMFKNLPFFAGYVEKPDTYSAWQENKNMLNTVPVSSQEDRELLQFLERRWLSKSTGSYTFLVNWMCPSFGLSLQAHPETTNSYARLPSDKLSDTYKNRVKAWKLFLPQPEHFPLILTRPANIQEYLPSSVIDVTDLLPGCTMDRMGWFAAWHAAQKEILKRCDEQKLDVNAVICIQRVQQEDIGGIRLLPLVSATKETIDKQYEFLLEWISRFGLSANRVELDRCCFLAPSRLEKTKTSVQLASKQDWLSMLDSADKKWKSTHAQKSLMFKGTLQALMDLTEAITPEKWEEIARSPTRASAASLVFSKIADKLHFLENVDADTSFLDVAVHLELVHADLASLLEIFSPFDEEKFISIFQKHLISIPEELKHFAKYGIHSSGMTSLAGILKAVQKTSSKKPRILFGENTYYEAIYAIERIGHVISTIEATDEDWKEADLLIAQYNPALKRINFSVTEYHAEKIEEFLHKALRTRSKPLTLALDCTLDYSNSARVGTLLATFKEEIKRGDLNIIGFRSGIKYDLFGMDNYCGAPFFMIHNEDTKWTAFASLLTDPALKTDRLSLNWFCLAYKNAASYLEMYRKQIFDNTRALLNKIPENLYYKDGHHFRVIPMSSDTDPSFIDIKIYGPCHEVRGGLLVGVFLTVECMKAGHPLLFRPGLGFYHPNLAVLFGDECTTVRLTLGLDPAQVDVMAKCFERISTLNGIH